MPPVKKGLILRSEIRRVPCPKCGAAPGAFCTTFDKREHQERASAAIAASPSDNTPTQATPLPADGVALLPMNEAPSQVIMKEVHVEVQPTPPADPVFDAIPEPDDDDGKAFNAYLARLKEKQKLVKLSLWHGPHQFDWIGYITHNSEPYVLRDVTLVQEDGKYVTLMPGENDTLVIRDL